MRTAMEILGLDETVVIHAGNKAYPLAEKIRAVPLSLLI